MLAIVQNPDDSIIKRPIRRIKQFSKRYDLSTRNDQLFKKHIPLRWLSHLISHLLHHITLLTLVKFLLLPHDPYPLIISSLVIKLEMVKLPELRAQPNELCDDFMHPIRIVVDSHPKPSTMEHFKVREAGKDVEPFFLLHSAFSISSQVSQPSTHTHTHLEEESVQ